MASKQSIMNAAFLHLGTTGVNSLGDDAPDIVKQMSQMYDIYYDSLLASNYWRFALKQTPLSKQPKEAFDPVLGFDNAYKLPSDYLLVYKIEPQGVYKIYGNLIYSNISSNFKLYYIHKVSEASLPPYYITFLAEKFAHLFAMPVTQDVNLAIAWDKASENSRKMAIALDDQSQTSEILQYAPLVSAKYGLSYGGF
jgi:hypothetical protein